MNFLPTKANSISAVLSCYPTSLLEPIHFLTYVSLRQGEHRKMFSSQNCTVVSSYAFFQMFAALERAHSSKNNLKQHLSINWSWRCCYGLLLCVIIINSLSLICLENGTPPEKKEEFPCRLWFYTSCWSCQLCSVSANMMLR